MPKNKRNVNIQEIPQTIGKFADTAALSYLKKVTSADTHKPFATPQERNRELTKIHRTTILISALYGAVGVLLLYIPQYIFPDFFAGKSYKLPYLTLSVEISVLESIYGLVLVAIELWLLTMLDIKAVGHVAVVFGFPPKVPFNAYDTEGKELVYISLGKESKTYTEIGINPFQRMTKAGLLALLLVFRLKAFLSNLTMKLVVKRLLGRITIRAVVDLIALPIYAFWNAYAASVVFRKIKMRMLADELMRTTGKEYFSKLSANETLKSFIYDALEFIAISKKTYHATDYIYAKHLLTIFSINKKNEHFLREKFLEDLSQSDTKIRTEIGKILIIGFVLDGKIGTLEIRILKKLKNMQIITYDIQDIKEFTKKYASGMRFDDLFN